MDNREQDTTPSLWQRVWRAPEPEISAAGFSGEKLIAWLRVVLIVLLVYFQTAQAIRNPNDLDLRVLLASGCGALLGALMIYSATRRHWGKSWIGFASSLLDVSLV